MANYIASDTDLTAVADAIRTKGGTAAQLTFPSGFVSAIGAITTGDNIDHEDLPAYVKAEALAVAERVKAHLQNDSIVILTGTDGHQIETGSNAANTMAGNLHAGMAMKALAYMLPIDFAAYLGDYTAGSSTTGIEEGLGHFASINSYIDKAFRGLPQFRTVGNHDSLGYSYSQNGKALTQAELYELIGSYNDDGVTVMGSTVAGYCYRDFAAKSLRVICLNTADVAAPTGGAEAVTDAQKKWFADTLISTPQDYGIIILAHHPLDWGNIMSVSHILRAYVEEQASMTIGGTTYSFTGKNKSAWMLQLHGHVHCYKTDNLHWNNGGTGVAYDVKRIGLPCTNFVRTNEYGDNGSSEYYGVEFGMPGDTPNEAKTAGGSKDTSFNVLVVNPSEEKVYCINYGAGYDREVYWGAVVVPVTGVTLNANSGTLNPGSSLTLTATVAPSDASNKAVTWSSSNTAVATVNNGVVSAVGIGSATITVTTQDGGFTASYALTVQAVPQGNLIGVIGYTDGKRISTGNGTYRELAGGVVIEYIDLYEYRQSDGTVVIRTKGALLQSWQSGANYNNNAYVFYKSSKTFQVGNYLTEGSSTHGSITVTRAFAGDADNTMTLTITGLSTSASVADNYRYMRICGLGSGANIDLRINENFD